MEHLALILLNFLESQTIFAPILIISLEEMGLPTPLTDAVIMYVGFQISRGKIAFFSAYLIILLAELIGSSILYFLSSYYGNVIVSKYGKYVRLDTHKLQFLESKFNKFGALFIIIGRHIPGVRVPVTIFSGMSKISYPVFLLSTFISVVFWIPFYLSVGMKIGPKTVQIFHQHITASLILCVILVLLYIIPVVYLRKRRRHANHLQK